MKGKPIFVSIDVILTGERIHGLMDEKGYSVRDIQEKLNLIYPQCIYRWIHGEVLPSVDNLYRLGKILGVHMEDLLVEMGTADKADKTE